MNQDTTMELRPEQLNEILSKALGRRIVRADCRTEQLHGGTLGDVRLVSGTAVTDGGESLPYKLVWKRQKKWERDGDPDSWRREYDLYESGLASAFTGALRPPACYHQELKKDGITLWLEYIDGVSGFALTTAMLARAALELGRFQGRAHKRCKDIQGLCGLGDEGYMERLFGAWHRQSYSYDFFVSKDCFFSEQLKESLRSGDIALIEGKSFEYSYLRSAACGIPAHLREMLMDLDTRREAVFEDLRRLPVVLCHKDFWCENIFYTADGIRLIDWDTAGWGYMGEDIASLIVDDMPADRIAESCRSLIPAYLTGISEAMEVPPGLADCILTMALIKFGYRMLQAYIYSQAPEAREWGAHALEAIYGLSEESKKGNREDEGQ